MQAALVAEHGIPAFVSRGCQSALFCRKNPAHTPLEPENLITTTILAYLLQCQLWGCFSLSSLSVCVLYIFAISLSVLSLSLLSLSANCLLPAHRGEMAAFTGFEFLHQLL